MFSTSCSVSSAGLKLPARQAVFVKSLGALTVARVIFRSLSTIIVCEKLSIFYTTMMAYVIT